MLKTSELIEFNYNITVKGCQVAVLIQKIIKAPKLSSYSLEKTPRKLFLHTKLYVKTNVFLEITMKRSESKSLDLYLKFGYFHAAPLNKSMFVHRN